MQSGEQSAHSAKNTCSLSAGCALDLFKAFAIIWTSVFFVVVDTGLLLKSMTLASGYTAPCRQAACRSGLLLLAVRLVKQLFQRRSPINLLLLLPQMPCSRHRLGSGNTQLEHRSFPGHNLPLRPSFLLWCQKEGAAFLNTDFPVYWFSLHELPLPLLIKRQFPLMVNTFIRHSWKIFLHLPTAVEKIWVWYVGVGVGDDDSWGFVFWA